LSFTREIPQYINGAWFGWHAFHRGLGTRLNEMGVDDKEIQSILRHAEIGATTGILHFAEHRTRQGWIDWRPEHIRHG
jgi:integrase